MSNHTSDLLKTFESSIMSERILDAEGVHHQLASGMHGRKLDFDLIDSHWPLHAQWVGVNVEFVTSHFDKGLAGVVGVANGTNRLALDMAKALQCQAFTTDKTLDQSIVLSDQKCQRLSQLTSRDQVVVVEDVGTSGGSAVVVAELCRKVTSADIAIVFTWQRMDTLTKAQQSTFQHYSLITHPLPTYNAEECRQSGYCSQGWHLIER